MHSLWQDVRYALRLLARNPGFTAVAILTLALSMGANTAMFTVVNGVLLRPMPFPEPDRLFLVSFTPQGGPFENAPGLLDRHYLDFRRDDRLFESLTSFFASGVTLTGAGDPIRIPVTQVTPNFFRVLRVRASLGRDFAADEDQPGHDQVVVLSDALWRSRFAADPHIQGKSVRLDGVDRTVIGVMPPGFSFPNNAQAWLPHLFHSDPHKTMMSPVLGRLKPGASRQAGLTELETFVHRLPSSAPDDFRNWRPRILPLKELLVSKVRQSLAIFMGAVGFVLLIGCANVANLLLARAVVRQQEMAVRAALGAGRWQLFRQMLAESTLLSLAGGAAGVLVAAWGVPALLALAPAGRIPRLEMIHIDGFVLAFTFGVSVLAGAVFGLVPAFQATRQHLRESLSPGTWSTSRYHERLRGAMVISEIALALVLLTSAGLLLKSFARLRAVNPGFNPEDVLAMTVDLPDSIYGNVLQMQQFHSASLEKLSHLPGVVAAGLVNWRPLGGELIKGDFNLEGGRPLPQGFMADKLCISPNYFQVMGIRLLRGREFSGSDTASAPGVAILSQSVAKALWPGEDSLGKRISMEDHPKPEDWLTIVGLVDDVKQEDLAAAPDPAIYQPYPQVPHTFFLNHATFVVRTNSDPQRVASGMRAALRDVDRNQPVASLATMQELIAETTGEPRFQARLLGTFAFLALALAALGVYGVISYSVAQRTREIGIRMALGAQPIQVMKLVVTHGLALTCLGIAIGLGGSYWLTQFLSGFLFGITARDPLTFVGVAALLAMVALAACVIPARRAMRVDPLVALRYE